MSVFNPVVPSRFVRIGDNKFEILASNGRIKNPDFGDRETKNFTITADFATAESLTKEMTGWSLVEVYSADSEETIPGFATNTLTDENGNVIGFEVEYDNSAFNILGDITVHNNGTVTIEYAKPSDLDEARIALDGLVFAALSE